MKVRNKCYGKLNKNAKLKVLKEKKERRHAIILDLEASNAIDQTLVNTIPVKLRHKYESNFTLGKDMSNTSKLPVKLGKKKQKTVIDLSIVEEENELESFSHDDFGLPEGRKTTITNIHKQETGNL